MFYPRHNPLIAHRMCRGGRTIKEKQRCAQDVPPNRRGDRRHCIAPATLWCIRSVGVLVVATSNPVRQGGALCPHLLLCLQSRSKFAPCAKLSLGDLPFLTPRPQADQKPPGRNSGCKW